MSSDPPEPGPSSPSAARELLAADRDDTAARVAALTRERAGIVESSELVATDDEHDPEGATIAFERAQITALLSQAEQHLADLDLALDRVADGTYGVCERCGRPIGMGRLEARPTARTCIACAAAGRS